MTDLMNYEGLLKLQPDVVIGWVVIIAILIGGLLLAKKMRGAREERARLVAEFAAGIGLVRMPGGQANASSMHFQGTWNGRRVGIGMYMDQAGRKQSNPKIFAYAHCDSKGFEMTMEQGIFRMGGTHVKSGDGEIDHQFLSKANDPLKARRLLDIDTVAKIKGIWKKEKEVNRLLLSHSTLIFIGRNRWKRPAEDMLSIVASSFSEKPPAMPIASLPMGQGVAFIGKGLPGLGIGVNKEMFSMLLDLAVSLAEKAEK